MRYVHDHICINTDFFTISVVIHEIISDCHKVLVFHTDGQCSYGVKASCGESPPPSRLGGLRRRLGGLKRLGRPKQGSALSPRRRHKNIADGHSFQVELYVGIGSYTV